MPDRLEDSTLIGLTLCDESEDFPYPIPIPILYSFIHNAPPDGSRHLLHVTQETATSYIKPYRHNKPLLARMPTLILGYCGRLSLGVRGMPVHRLHPVQRSVRLLRAPSHQSRPITLSSGFRHSGLSSMLL